MQLAQRVMTISKFKTCVKASCLAAGENSIGPRQLRDEALAEYQVSNIPWRSPKLVMVLLLEVSLQHAGGSEEVNEVVGDCPEQDEGQKRR